jgi:GMP synthase-like glutamine amidotransferase
MRIHVIKHERLEGPGAIAAWAGERGHRTATTELSLGEPLPRPADFDALVLMGGSMSVNDEDRFAWLRPEKQLVRDSLDAGRKILGICLGAQMIASALGAPVTQNPEKEIGWFPVEATDAGWEHPFWLGLPRALPVFHWHGETFGLPKGAVHLLRSAACEHQGYAIGSQALALQCHPEVDAVSVAEMVENGRGELESGRWFIQTEEAIKIQSAPLARLRPVLYRLLDQWLSA